MKNGTAGQGKTIGGTLYFAGLAVVLYGFWLMLSGHSTPLLLSLGALSSIAIVLFMRRMDILDDETYPMHLLARGLGYWPWLAWEIVKSNRDVIRIIVDPRLPISPQLFKAKASQHSDMGKVIYANSITLTPGTISVDLEGDTILVHALTRAGMEGVQSGDMDRRAAAMEGGR